MLKRQRTGSVVCASCGSLVGVNDEQCYSCGRRNPGLWGYGPVLRQFGNDLGFLSLVVGGCSAIYGVMMLLTIMRGGNLLGGNPLSFLSPSWEASFLFGASGAEPIFRYRRWWTPLSASWLHGGVLHILFNMMAVRQLGPATADLYGPGRMVILYTFGGVIGFLTSSIAFLVFGNLGIPFLQGGYRTLGASASIFGLLGALVYYGRRSGSSIVHREAMGYVTSMIIMGVLLPGIDNFAHAGGFVGGYFAAIWMDPLKPERMDHFAGAAVCILLSALAILASIVTGWRYVFG